MIRDSKKLPENILTKIPQLVNEIATDSDVIALYAFGSLAKGILLPLSDLDFGLLLSNKLDKLLRSDKHLELLGKFNTFLQTDEVDLVLMNNAPHYFAYTILKSGKRLFVGDKGELIDFYEKTIKLYLDFKILRDNFDKAFLDGIGYRG